MQPCIVHRGEVPMFHGRSYYQLCERHFEWPPFLTPMHSGRKTDSSRTQCRPSDLGGHYKRAAAKRQLQSRVKANPARKAKKGGLFKLLSSSQIRILYVLIRFQIVHFEPSRTVIFIIKLLVIHQDIRLTKQTIF